MSVDKHTTRLPAYKCPDCGEEMDAVSSLAHEPIAPKPGDISMCLYCGAWLKFADDLVLRLMTEADITALPDDVFIMLQRMGAARAHVMPPRKPS